MTDPTAVDPPAARDQDVSTAVRVVVVVDWRRQRVHGITCDDAEAQRWTRKIVDKYRGDRLAATMAVGLAYPPARAAVDVAPPS